MRSCDPDSSSISSSLLSSLPPAERQRHQRLLAAQQQDAQVEELQGVVAEVEALFREVEAEVGAADTQPSLAMSVDPISPDAGGSPLVDSLRESLRLAATKLPIATKFISRHRIG